MQRGGHGERRPWQRALDGLAVGAGWALFGLAALVAFEVLARKFFAYSIKGVDEIGGYVLAAASAAGFIYALAQRGHIRVDIAFRYLGVRWRAMLHVAAHVLLAAFAVLLVWRTLAVWLHSTTLRAVAPTPLATPLALPQGVWLVGLLIFAICTIALAIAVTRALVKGGAHEVERQFHADALEEELKAEKADAARRGAGTESR